MYRNIMVAFDGSPGSRAALERARAIAAASGGSLSLVRSVDSGPLREGATPKTIASASRELERDIRRLDPELEAEKWVVGGPAGEALLTATEDSGIDLIVTGSRHRGTIARTLLGSVSSELVHNAKCDVLVVHPVED